MKNLNSQIPYIKEAQKLSPHPLKLFGNPWLAPDWVKTNITLNQLKGEVGGEYYNIRFGPIILLSTSSLFKLHPSVV